MLPRRRGCLCLFLPGAALVGDAAAEGNSLCCALFAHTSRLLLAKSKSHAEEAAPQQHLSTPEIILLFLNGKSFCLLHVLALPMSAWYIGEWCVGAQSRVWAGVRHSGAVVLQVHSVLVHSASPGVWCMVLVLSTDLWCIVSWCQSWCMEHSAGASPRAWYIASIAWCQVRCMVHCAQCSAAVLFHLPVWLHGASLYPSEWRTVHSAQNQSSCQSHCQSECHPSARCTLHGTGPGLGASPGAWCALSVQVYGVWHTVHESHCHSGCQAQCTMHCEQRTVPTPGLIPLLAPVHDPTFDPSALCVLHGTPCQLHAHRACSTMHAVSPSGGLDANPSARRTMHSPRPGPQRVVRRARCTMQGKDPLPNPSAGPGAGPGAGAGAGAGAGSGRWC